MKTNKPIRVFLVDDHPVVRDGYRRLLDNNPDIEVVAEANSGEEACQQYTQAKPDVVVLDLNMPGIGGIETISRLLSKDSEAHILVFSMHDSQIMISRALEAGASGYLTKSSAASQMIDAVRSVAQGKPFLSHTIAPSIIGKLQKNDSNPLQVLSKREFEVFRRLADGNSVAEIANELSISPKTAGVHQTNIMRKLELRNTAELTRLAIRCGVIEA
jgi:two-component system invasion response regulator UvrY